MSDRPAATKKVIMPTDRPRKTVSAQSSLVIPSEAVVNKKANTPIKINRVRCLRRNAMGSG